MTLEQITTLQSVGLSNKESRAYLALLELGRGSAASVARKADLKTPTAYVVLKDLINKGFVHRVPRAKKQLFVAESPQAALAAIENRTAEFQLIVPALSALSRRAEDTKARTLFFEGEAGMRKCYNYRIDEVRDCEIVAFFASAEDITPAFTAELVSWSRVIAARNVTTRAIVPDHPSLLHWRRLDTEFKRNIKVVSPEMYSARNSVEIFPEFVRIVMYKNMQGIILDDIEIANSFHQIFDMVWNDR